jgi:hypothetical protein
VVIRWQYEWLKHLGVWWSRFSEMGKIGIGKDQEVHFGLV